MLGYVSPAIKRWLGETVGKESETLDRHDRWLCMMYPRLALLRQFLREDGSIELDRQRSRQTLPLTRHFLLPPPSWHLAFCDFILLALWNPKCFCHAFI
jgi:hypothetical protein